MCELAAVIRAVCLLPSDRKISSRQDLDAFHGMLCKAPILLMKQPGRCRNSNLQNTREPSDLYNTRARHVSCLEDYSHVLQCTR